MRTRIAYVKHASIALAALALAGTVHAENVLDRGKAPERDAPTTTLPDWFLPVWDAYDRNPAITPDFDFAMLYSTDVRPRQPEHR